VKTADLSRIFESLGYRNIRTYVQSGNVIFECNQVDTSAIANKIENRIYQTYRFAIKAIVRTADELGSIVAGNPFVKETKLEIDKLHVTFLSSKPDERVVSNLDIRKDKNEKYMLVEREIYLYCPNGYGRTKLNNTTFEKKLNTIATTRNWKTTNKLLEIAETIAENKKSVK